MKKFTVALLALLTTFQAFALRSGDDALEPLKVKWLAGAPFRFALPQENKENGKKLSIAVFLLCRARQSPSAVMMLESLASRYGKRVNIAVITPDSESDLEALLRMVPVKSISAGVDEERKLTAEFMAGSLLYPMAFVSDSRGRLLWNGETVDLGEMVERFFAGTFNARAAREIAPMLDELHTCLRDNDDRKMRRLVNDILALEPGNAAALRMRLFSLEQRNRKLEAWQLVSEALEKAPQVARLYFTAVDLIIRDAVLAGQLEKVLVNFERNVSDPEPRALMAYTLCERTSYDTAAVKGAEKLLANCRKEQFSSRSSLALFYAAKAAAAYRLCRLDEAIRAQQECVEEWKNSGNHFNAASAAKRLDYFKSLGN